MSKQQLWIFGDSFSDKNNSFFKYDGKESWPILIEDFYDVTNFSITGSGPHLMLQMLCNKISTNCKNIIVLFFLGDCLRIDLNSLDKSKQWCIREIILDRIDNMFADQKNKGADQNPKLLKFVKENEKNTKWMGKEYLLQDAFLNIEPIKILSTLKIISEKFKKIIVFPCFQHEAKVINNFNIINNNIFFVDKQELHKRYSDSDYHPNHIPIKQHKDFLNYVRKIIDE